MKLTMCPISYNGQTIPQDQFGYVLKQGHGFNPEGVDEIRFWCGNGKKRICGVALTLGEQANAGEGGKRRWHWDGNMEAPTITPSIGCDARCGWHGHITAGDMAK